MRILMVFIDMLRSELVFSTQADSQIMKTCRKIGGTLFEACYTPAPDTYRSMGALWSSCYPAENGCDNRCKRPFEWLKKPEETFLEYLLSSGYIFNSYVGAWEGKNVGLFPNVYTKYPFNFSTGKFIKEYTKEIFLGNDSFTFLNLEDLHFILDDKSYTLKAYKEGEKKICDLIDSFFEIFPVEQFDEIIFFSDHGFRFWNEKGGYSLDKRRTNIFLFWHEKNDASLKIDRKLRSIMDIYPTLLNKCGIYYSKSNIRGKDLFGEEYHNELLLEDHTSFYATILDSVNCWGVVTNAGIQFCNSDLVWNDGMIHSELQNLLLENGTGYKMLSEFIDRERKLYNVDEPKNIGKYTSDGEKRVTEKINGIERFLGKIKNIL